jgi:hypothetical protein
MLHQFVSVKQFTGKSGRRFERFWVEAVRPPGGQLYQDGGCWGLSDIGLSGTEPGLVLTAQLQDH